MPKPVRKHRRFIDKKRDNVTTFRLVHRSQRDPLAADHDAPQRVLQPISERAEVDQARREEQRQFGVYFDDDYNYLQHLKPKEEALHWEEVEDKFTVHREPETAKSNVKLPSSVFASEYEENIGLLNRAAPRSGPLVGLNSDVLEVLETLDDAFDVEEVVKGEELAKVFGSDDDGDAVEVEEDELDDILAGMVSNEGGNIADSDDEYETDESDFSDGDGDEEGQFMFGKEETKSKFTEYSMSSSVIKRSEQLTILDDRFEKFFDAYEDENTGGLDLDEIEGHRQENSSVMTQIIEEFERNKATERQKPEFKATDLRPVEEEGDSDCGERETELLEVEAPQEKWDCESILSTYSNIYHHPKLISEPSKKVNPIKISGKTGIPKDVFGKGLTVGALKQLDRETGTLDDEETCTLTSRVSELSVRNKHETLEEKKARKHAFREYKRERRVEKKCNKLAFKEENERQQQNILNNMRNIQGQKLL